MKPTTHNSNVKSKKDLANSCYNIKEFQLTTHNQQPTTKQGFTLLELLVVISIIGILIALGVASYSVAQKKGRDARRSGDLKAIQNAMEECYSLDMAYPTTVTPGSALTCTGGTQVMPSVPADPKSGNYSFTLAAATYTICADLEGDGDWAIGGVACEFEVTNLQ